MYIFVSFRGVVGSMKAFSTRPLMLFAGQWLAIPNSRDVPVFLAIFLLVWKREFLGRAPGAFSRCWSSLFVLKLLFGGLRGSRCQYCLGSFLASGRHPPLELRRVPRRLIVVGLGLSQLLHVQCTVSTSKMERRHWKLRTGTTRCCRGKNEQQARALRRHGACLDVHALYSL